MNEREFRSRFRKMYGKLYGRALKLFRAFGSDLRAPLVRIFSGPNPQWKGEIKRTVIVLERIENELAVLMDAPMSHREKLNLLESLHKELKTMNDELPEKNRNGNNGTKVLHSSNESSAIVPLVDGKR